MRDLNVIEVVAAYGPYPVPEGTISYDRNIEVRAVESSKLLWTQQYNSFHGPAVAAVLTLGDAL